MATTSDKCYLCFDDATEGNPFIDPNPCACKGSVKLHSSCAEELMNKTVSCGVCKNAWSFTGIKRTYVPILPEGSLALELPVAKSDSATGSLYEEIHYVNGIRHGLYKKYYQTSDVNAELMLEVEANYINGECVYPAKIYYPCSGSLKAEVHYVNGELNGLCKYYYETGELFEEYNYLIGLLEGSYKSFYKNGQLYNECNYVNDMREGPYKQYYENGQLQEEQNYVNNCLNGQSKTYFMNGNISCEKNYINNIMEGVCKNYYNSGQLKDEFNYINGIINGPYKSYYDNCQLQEESNFVNGKLHGLFKLYYKNGQLRKEGIYNNGSIRNNEINKCLSEMIRMVEQIEEITPSLKKKPSKSNIITKFKNYIGCKHVSVNA